MTLTPTRLVAEIAKLLELHEAKLMAMEDGTDPKAAKDAFEAQWQVIDEWRASLTRLLADWNDAEVEAAINPMRGSPADQPRLDAEAADLKRKILGLLS